MGAPAIYGFDCLARGWSISESGPVAFNVDAGIFKMKHVALVLFLLDSAALSSACLIHLRFLPGFCGHGSFETAALSLKY